MIKKDLSNIFKLFYGIGGGGFSMLMQFEAYYFIAFLTDYAKLPLGIIAGILTFTGICDFVFGALSGYVIYRFNFKWGKYRSWFLLAAIVVLLTFTFQFTSVGNVWLSAILICMGFVLSHAFATVGQISTLTMMVTVTNNPILRGRLASRRSQYIALFGIVFSLSAYPLLTYIGNLTSRILGFTITAFIISLLFAITFFITYKTTDGYEHIEGSQEAAPFGLLKMIGVIAKNPPLIFLMISDLIRSIGGFIIVGFAFYYYTYSVHLPALMAVHMTLSALGSLVGATINPFFDKIIVDAKKRYLFYLSMTSIFLLAASIFSQHPYVVVCLFAASFIFNGASFATSALLYANTSVYSEWKNGNNFASVIMGLTELPIKLSIIIKGLLIAGILSILGIVAGQETSAQSSYMISKIITLVPALTTIISGTIVYFLYPLNKHKLEELQSEIRNRSTMI